MELTELVGAFMLGAGFSILSFWIGGMKLEELTHRGPGLFFVAMSVAVTGAHAAVVVAITGL